MKPLDQEILLLVNKLGRARWVDVKRNLSPETQKQVGEHIDTYVTRSLKRLINNGYIEKAVLGRYPRPRYYLSLGGSIGAYKLFHGMRVDDPFRDGVLAFGHVLQWIKSLAIIEAGGEDVRDYFESFKELVNSRDIDGLLEEAEIEERFLKSEADPWDDQHLVL